MKITYIEVEATQEDLKASKNLSENLYDVLNNTFAKINKPSETDEPFEEVEE